VSRLLFQIPVMRAFANLAGLNRRSAQVPHTHQVVGGTGEGEYPVHLKNPAMTHFPQQRDRLQPPEAFLDAISLPLADGIARVPLDAPK
jgi:hypothetical protein